MFFILKRCSTRNNNGRNALSECSIDLEVIAVKIHFEECAFLDNI